MTIVTDQQPMVGDHIRSEKVVAMIAEVVGKNQSWRGCVVVARAVLNMISFLLFILAFLH